jgi:hypothetical protein
MFMVCFLWQKGEWQAAVVQRLHQIVAVLEHGALVDGALVGDFALVDGRRLGHHVQRAMRLALPVVRLPVRPPRAESALHRRAGHHLGFIGASAPRPAS